MAEKKIGNILFVVFSMALIFVVAIAPFVGCCYLFFYVLNNLPGVYMHAGSFFEKIKFLTLFLIIGFVVLGFLESAIKRFVTSKSSIQSFFKYIVLFLINILYVQVFCLLSSSIDADFLGVVWITIVIYLFELLFKAFLYLLDKLNSKKNVLIKK